MRGKKLVALALSALMALAPLCACSQQGGQEAGSGEEEMTREPE